MTLTGILLTGGSASRLGLDKPSLRTPDGETLAVRTARLLRAVTDRVVEVGPGVSGELAVPDDAEGPLGGLVAAVRHLATLDRLSPVLLVASDLPRLGPQVLSLLADAEPGRSVVPVIGDVMQVLCARYSVEFLKGATQGFERGERSITRLVREMDTELFDVEAWDPDAVACFEDLDTPEDLERMVALGFLGG